MTLVKIRRDGNSSVVTLPPSEMEKIHLSVGEFVWVEADEMTGRLIVVPANVQPYARHDVLAVATEVVEEKRELFDRLAAYDRGERVTQ